MDENRHPPSW